MNTDIDFDIDFSGLKPQGVALVFPETEIHEPFVMPSKNQICKTPSTKNGFTVELDMPMSDYIDMQQLSSGAIATLSDGGCRLSLKYYLESRAEQTKAMRTGTLIHSMIEAYCSGHSLDQFMQRFHVMPPTNRGKIETTAAEVEFYCSILGLDAGDYFISEKITLKELKVAAIELAAKCEDSLVTDKEYPIIMGAYSELLRRKDLWWLRETTSEVTIYDGHIRCRPDGLLFYTNDNSELSAIIVSAKTIAQMNRVRWTAIGYGQKEAHYRYIVSRAFGIEPENVTTLFLFIETVAPYLSREVAISRQTAMTADSVYIDFMLEAVEAVTTCRWSGYEGRILEI